MKKFLVGLSAAALWSSAAAAHDFFLLPAQFAAPADKPITISATVGSNFPTPETVVTADRVDQLVVAGPGNPRLQVAGPGTKALTLQIVGAKPGLLATGVGTKPRDVDYAEDRIPLILGEYRMLPTAVAAVDALPKPRTWQVVSRRFAKTMMCVGNCKDRSAAEKSFGAHLEFIGSRSMDGHFRLLAQGKPLLNYPIDLVGSDGKRQHLTTDARGGIRLARGSRGTMMLFAARLEPPAGAGRFTLDLTSLTFSRP